MKIRTIIIICLFLTISGCISPAIAASTTPEYEYQEDQIDQVDPELDDSFNMPPGDIMIDDTLENYDQFYETETNELSNLHGFEGLEILASYIATHFDHRLGASTTAQGVKETGYGDCWGLSDFAKEILLKNGYQVKLVQSVTSEAPNHRYLEVQDDEIREKSNTWATFDPSHVTRKYGYGPYYKHFGKKTSVLGVYP
ncbi:hypothetical protein DSECCO2_431500 [anaerobic digester metagenome]